MRLRGRNLWLIVAVAVLALALAAPAVARTANDPNQTGWVGGLCRGLGSMAESLAELFGMSTGELADARAEGKSLADIADDKGVSEDEVLDTMLEQRREALQQAVEDGRLTQEQADAMLQRMESRAKDRLDDPSTDPQSRGGCGIAGPDGGSGAGGCGGYGPGGPGAVPQGTSI